MLQKITSDTTRAYQSLQALRLGSSILLSIVLVKLSFTKNEIGDFEWFLFLTNAVSFFWSMGLLNAFKSYFPAQNGEDQSSLITTLGIVFLSFGLVASFGISYSGYGKELIFQDNFIYFSIFLILGITASISEHILIVKEKSQDLFYYGFLSYAGYFVGLSIVAFMLHSISALFMFLAFWAGIRFLYTVFLIHRYGSWTVDLGSAGKFIIYASPLIVHVLLGGGMEYIDGYLVDAYYTREEFTVFRYGARELPINTIFITAMVATMMPLAVNNLKLTLAEIKTRLNGLMHWLFPISIILMLTSPLIFRTIYDDGYIESAFVFNIYLLILCSRIVLPQVILYARQKNSILMWVGLVELIINILLSLYLIEDYGILGIASATVVAYVVQKILLVFYCQIRLGIRLSFYLDIKLHTIYSLLLYVVFAIAYNLY